MMIPTHDFVVGDSGCTFGDILTPIISSSISLTDFHIFSLMILLKTGEPTKNTVQNRIRHDITLYECLEKILIEWRSRVSNEALLTTLIHHLRQCGLKVFADILQNMFWPSSTSEGTLEECLGKQFDKVIRASGLHISRNHKRNVNTIIACCISLMLGATIVSIICGAISMVKMNLQNRAYDRSLSQENFIGQYHGEILPQNEHNRLDDLESRLNKSTSLPENLDVGLTEPDRHKALHKTDLVVNDPKVLLELFVSKTSQESLVRLEFNNSLGQICEKNKNEEFNTDTLILPRLVELVMDVSTDCEILIDGILDKIVMNYVKVLRFKGHLTNAFVQQFHEFLHLYYRSLEEIHVLGAFDSPINIFEVRNKVVLNMVKVISLHLEDVSGTTVSRKMINDRFCSIFPKLESLEIKRIYISLGEFFKLLNCPQIQHLDITVRISRDDITMLEQLNLDEKVHSIKSITVSFKFDVCPDHIFFSKFIDKFDLIEKYRLCSNCNMSPMGRIMRCTQKSKPKL